MIKTNHKETECDSKWAACHAFAIFEPHKLPGEKMEGFDIALDWNVTEHWWWLATHFAFRKVSICPTGCIFVEGQCSATSGSLTCKEQAEQLLDGLKGSVNLEGFKAEEKINSKTVLKSVGISSDMKEISKEGVMKAPVGTIDQNSKSTQL